MRSPSEPRKILILGACGFIGRHLFAKLGPERAIATYYPSPIPHGVYFDALTMKLSDIFTSPAQISHAVILIAIPNMEQCVRDPRKSHAINVECIQSILRELKSWGIKPIFTSTESVWDGTRGGYVEDDPVNPILLYGKHKVEVERYMQREMEDYLILRVAKVYGTEPDDGTLFTSWLKLLRNNQPAYVATDQTFSPIFVEDVVEGILSGIQHDCRGIFHLSNHRPYSRAELFQMLSGHLHEHMEIRSPVLYQSIHDFKHLLEKRPLNVSMKPDKLVEATGLRIRDAEELCQRIVTQAFSPHILTPFSR